MTAPIDYDRASWTLGGAPIQGMNRYFVGTSGVATMTGAMHTANSFMQGAWDDDPNKFKQLGSDAADVVGEASMMGMGLVLGAQHLRSLRANSGAYVNGLTYQKAGEIWHGAGHAGTLSDVDMKAALKQKGNFKVNVVGGQPYRAGMKGAVSRLGGTYRPMGWKGNLGMMAAQMAVSIGAKMAFGFAGKVLDEAYSEQRHFRQPHYDNRYFNTKQYDMSSYQQLGAAMDSYENRMMSVARIYHAR